MTTADQIRKLYTNRGLLYQRIFVDFLGWGGEIEAFFRASNFIGPNFKILDAGCGTGIITRILFQLARERNCAGVEFHAFDLTQRMLEILREWLAKNEMPGVELRQADVLEIETLPSHWREYDLIVSSTMLEYLPRDKLGNALAGLKHLLKDGGLLLAFITKRNIMTRFLAEKLWRTNPYEESEVRCRFRDAGFNEITFMSLSPWWSSSVMVVEARVSSTRTNSPQA